MTTGEKIYRCRKRAGMTQEELAEKLGVSRQAVSKWESDAAFPETEKILELCKIFHLSADELLFGTEEVASGGENRHENADDGKGVTWGVIKHAAYRFEYISKRRVLGLPLLHVHFGAGLCRAHGIFAFGNFAAGFISAGFFSAGFVSVGLFTVGLLALGTFALGCLACGSIVAGILAFGAIAIGTVAYGAVAIGQVAIGALAVGHYAVGDWANGYLAVGRTHAEGAHAFLLPQEWEAFTAFARELPRWVARLISPAASIL